jgi:hypothetical protein
MRTASGSLTEVAPRGLFVASCRFCNTKTIPLTKGVAADWADLHPGLCPLLPSR